MASNLENASLGSLRSTIQRSDPILSNEARRVLEIIFTTTFGGFIGVLGSAVNVINIIVFVKQGFKDSVGVSLCALAVSDLGFLLLMIIFSICSQPLAQHSNIRVDISEIYHTIGGLLTSFFVSTTNLITAFITFERCVCVALPLKVKSIITPKRTLTTMISIYVFIFASSLPIFSYVYVEQSFMAEGNRTLLLLTYTSHTFQNVSNSFITFTQILSFIIVIICTVVLVLKLLSKSKWRNNAVLLSEAKDVISARDKKVMKMIISISIIFIACYLPSVVDLILVIYLSPEYSASGSYKNSYLVSWEIIDCIGGINSTVSILIYYNMSSKFRKTFQAIFLLSTK